MSVHLTISDQSGAETPASRAVRMWLLRRLGEALRRLHLRAGEWSISLVGDEAMCELHERTMGLGSTTDVLTFDLRELGSRAAEVLELDTVICVDEAGQRAREMGHAVRDELLLYAVHSLLHVQGYDDRTAAGARRMHEREDELLVELGVGRVFAARGRAGGSGVPARRRTRKGKRA